MTPGTNHSLNGTLLGTAVGDSLGLPYEGLGRRRIAAMGPVRFRLLFGKGLVSDDTEHSLMLASALRQHPGDPSAMQSSFARKLRWWLIGLPAGVGLGTARSILRLWLGFPIDRAAVKSAGNGAAMRSPIVGVFFCDDPEKRREFAVAACRVTHRDPRAEESAILVAEAAALAAQGTPDGEVLSKLRRLATSQEMSLRFESISRALEHKASVDEFAESIGCGARVSGFAPDTVAVALYAWLRHRGDFAGTIEACIRCGGDTDTVAAIAGGISGAEVGEEGIPGPWVRSIIDWPRSVAYIKRVAAALGDGSKPRSTWFVVPAIPLRNLVFLVIVLAHGVRRWFPPY